MTDADGLRELYSGILNVRIRRMFGGQGIFDGESMFALEHGGALYIKTDGAMRELLSAAGCEPFAFQKTGKLVLTSYWTLPAAALDDREELRRWTDLACAAAHAIRRRGSPRSPALPR